MMPPRWNHFRRCPAFRGKSLVNRQLCRWLQNRDSLTTRLIAAGQGRFRVELLQQSMGIPRADERRVLGLASRQQAVIREVLLYVCDEPWVYARSVLPFPSLDGPLAYLKKLDNRPLGALLFSDPAMRRSPIEISRLAAAQIPATIDGGRWGRRSVFYLKNRPLLVSEVFLHEFAPRPQAEQPL